MLLPLETSIPTAFINMSLLWTLELLQRSAPDLLIACSSYCGVTRTYLKQFNLHKTNTANEELVISLLDGREVQERKPIYRLLHHYSSLSNKMGNSLLAVRDINHKYIVVERNTGLEILQIARNGGNYENY